MSRRKIQIETKRRAEQLYVNTDLTQREIAEMVGVVEKTMSDWVNADDAAWKVSRAARSITKEQIIRGYYAQLVELNEKISDREKGERFPTAAEADTMAKITKNINTLENQYNLGTYHQVLNEFMDWLAIHDGSAASTLAIKSVDFMKSKAQSFNGK